MKELSGMKVINTGNIYRIYGNDLKVQSGLEAKTYIVRFEQFKGFFLEEYSDMEVKEEKIYGVHLSKISKVTKTFKDFKRNLGVILSGDKGIGKSLFARLLCQEMVKRGYPVIVVDTFVPGIHSFIEQIKQEVVMLFDEFDKTFPKNRDDENGMSAQTGLLSLLDGVTGGKKLYLVTCNSFYSLSDYLINRPGRFHYHFRFAYPTGEEVRTYMQDKLDKKYWNQIDSVVEFAGRVNVNYDCLRAIAYELQNGEEFREAIKDLNILNLDDRSYNVTLLLDNGVVLDEEDYNVDFSSNRKHGMHVTTNEGNDLNVQFIPSKAKFNVEKGAYIIAASDLRVLPYHQEDKATIAFLVAHKPISLMFCLAKQRDYGFSYLS